jgi:hypothetical protein
LNRSADAFLMNQVSVGKIFLVLPFAAAAAAAVV